MSHHHVVVVTPAYAAIQWRFLMAFKMLVPAYAGMTIYQPARENTMAHDPKETA